MADNPWQNISLTVYIDINGDCVADGFTLISGSGTVHHGDPLDDSQDYPGTRPVDGHFDVLDAEIVAMDFDNGAESAVIGAGRGQNGDLQASLGVIAESLLDPSAAESFFDIFAEAYINGIYVYNQSAARLEAEISEYPPYNSTYTFTGCLPAFTSPIPGQGIQVGNITQVELTVGAEVSVPTMSQWGLLILALMVIALGTVAIVYRQKSPALITGKV